MPGSQSSRQREPSSLAAIILSILLILAALGARSWLASSSRPSSRSSSGSSSEGASSVGASTQLPGLRVIGSQLVNSEGQPMRLIGVNRARPQYTCLQGQSILGGPSTPSSIQAMKSWGINTVRIPLNEDCWLGINGAPVATSGNAYQTAIEQYVRQLHAQGLYVILELHFDSPGLALAADAEIMADADHSPAFWSSVATVFIHDHAVLFDLYNEPHNISWACWRDGCAVSTAAHGDWQTAGMQRLVTAVRLTGASQPILLAGLDFANDLSDWLAYQPVDPLRQLVASFHVYSDSRCSTTACWSQFVASVHTFAPVITTEIGEYDCASSFITTYMNWADSFRLSYLAWAWVPSDCAHYPSLIRDWSGTPTSFGAGFRAHVLATHASGSAYTAPSLLILAHSLG